MRSLSLVVVFSGMLSMVDVAQGATTYTYDDLGRLTRATYDNNRQIDYTYDPAGNRTQVATSTTPPHALLKPKATRSKASRKKH